MTTLRASLFVACVALALPGASAAQPAQPNPSFNLVNRGSGTIQQFFATPAGRSNWGRDRLDGRGLAAGGKAAIRLPADGNCVYDLRAQFADGRAEDKRELNVCNVDSVVMGEAVPAATPAAPGPATGATPGAAPAAPAATPTAARFFVLRNRSLAPITSIAARAQGTDAWRTNPLRTGPIPPAGERRIDLPPGGQCVFDLRVTFQGGTSQEKTNINLCTSPEQTVQ